MRSVSVRLADLGKVTIPIGFVGENLHTQVRIDCFKLFEDYPNAVPGLTVKPPVGDAYPAVVTRDGDYVVWEIEDSNLVNSGNGEIQLSFFVDEIIAKSYISRIRIEKSIIPTGDVPTPIEDWIDEANEKLAEVEKWDDVTAEATTIEPGEPATAEIVEESGHNKFVFGLPKGEQGDPGTPGFSPVVVVTDITGGHRVYVTDATRTQTFDVMDGEKGDTGNGIESAVLNQDYTLTLNFTDGTHYTTPSIRGAKGETGDTGNGIASVTLNQDYTLTITYTNGQSTTTASIRGEKGETGATPIISIGTVTTLQPGSDATATMDITDPEHPVLSFGIPEGEPGEVTEAELNAVADSKADVITDTASGSIATFQDGADSLPMEVTAEIVPVQDLHGQDSPWVGGAGKNLIPDTLNGGASSLTTGGLTLTVVNGKFHLSGTAGSAGTRSVLKTSEFVVKAGTYTLSKSADDNFIPVIQDTNGTALLAMVSTETSKTYTFASDTTVTFGVNPTANGTVYGEAGVDFSVQLESGSSATAWSPYSNLCPISGWTGANVSVSPTTDPDDPDKEVYTYTFPDSAGTVYGGTLTVNKDGSGRLVANKVSITVTSEADLPAFVSDGTNGSYAQIASDAKINNAVAMCICSMCEGISFNNRVSKSYKGKDRCYVDNAGKLTIRASNAIPISTKAEMVAEFNNAQIVYELATPVSFDFTASQIRSLLGTNNVWADSGNVLSVVYYADTKMYIDAKIAELQALVLEKT